MAAKAKDSPSEAEQSSMQEPETAEMVLTYDKNTGQVIRIENVDASGSRRELSEEEYAAFFGYSDAGAEQDAYDPSAVVYAITHQQAGFEQGYYQGLLEYEAALSGQTPSGYSPEEDAAYYQGMADYEALINQS